MIVLLVVSLSVVLAGGIVVALERLSGMPWRL